MKKAGSSVSMALPIGYKQVQSDRTYLPFFVALKNWLAKANERCYEDKSQSYNIEKHI